MPRMEGVPSAARWDDPGGRLTLCGDRRIFGGTGFFNDSGYIREAPTDTDIHRARPRKPPGFRRPTSVLGNKTAYVVGSLQSTQPVSIGWDNPKRPS